METIKVVYEPVHAKRHPDQRVRAVCEPVLFRLQLYSLDLVSSQQAMAKGAQLSSGDSLR